jgi:hypothetical protein
MKSTLLLILVFCSIFAIAQKKDSIPKNDLKSVELLVPHLIKEANTEKEKVERIYEWITSSIDYDYSKIDSDKPLSNVAVDKVLSTKKAICGEYCNLMQAMLETVNVKSEIINGYTHTTLRDSMIVPISDTHAWIAIKIGDEWFLADPTWDAGYLGNIKTDKEEKFAEKKENLEAKFVKKTDGLNTKLKSENKESKLKKINKKIDANIEKEKEAREALKKKKDGAKVFTGRIGFVSFPQKEWFLIPADSFLLKHLPVNPMWQLKNDTISIEVFSEGADSIVNRINESSALSFNYASEIEKYEKLDILERLIWDAEKGIDYSRKNSQLMALNYYNYLSFLTNKKIQKIASPKYKVYNYSQYLYMVDTARVYAKLAKKESKNNYTYFKKAYSKLYKEDQQMERLYSKMMTKLISNHEKCVDKIDSKVEKLESQNELLETKIEKLSSKFSSVSFKNDASAVKYLTDSLAILTNSFKLEKKKWKRATDSTSLQPLIDTMLYSRYLFRIRNIYVEYQDYEINADVLELDSMLIPNNVAMTSIYLDSLSIEMLTKDMYNIVTSISKFIIYAKVELAKLETEGEINDSGVILGSFNQVLLIHYTDLAEINSKAIAHDVWLIKTLGEFEAYLDDMDGFVASQENINEERFDYYMKANENNFNRDENLFEIIDKACKKWKVEFKEKSK